MSRSTNYVVLVAIFASLLSFSPIVYAQNSTNASDIGILYNQAKNTSMDLVNQAPGALKGAYNEAKNTSMDLVNQAVSLIKNDTNSSRLINQLETDLGNLVNEFSNFLSR
ncbi:MAG TPA: hypothetical protein VFT71_04605 [Candidatus Nitrosocosmicus sp.]|nr:hypothetical protein [Candidatus Nitrosocosmicus sp.]